MKCYLASLVLYILLMVTYPLQAETSSGPLLETGQKSYQTIPFKQSNTVDADTLLKVGLVTLLGLLMVFVLVIFIKKYQDKLTGGGDSKQRIHLQSVKRLSSKLILFIVEVDEREYLIAQSGDRVNMLEHVTRADKQDRCDE